MVVEEMPEMTREFLEAKSLQVARSCLGCGDLQAVKIARQPPGGSGPNWFASEFIPPLPPLAEKEARMAIVKLSGKYALMRGPHNF
jgi:hypothetical protein